MSRVFVSHTSELASWPQPRSCVDAAVDAVAAAGMVPVDMRYFPAADAPPAHVCRQRVLSAQVYVAVIGFRYGSLVPGMDLSYTELEFDTATHAGLVRVVLLMSDPPAAGCPVDEDRGRIDRFRRKLIWESDLTVAWFDTADRVQYLVFQGLTDPVMAAAPGTEGDVTEPRVPVSWDRLPALPLEGRRLLRAQMRAADSLPYHLYGPRRPALSQVYVRQELSVATDRSQARGDAGPDGEGDQQHWRLAGAGPVRALVEVLAGGEHLLVIGGPGQGKSTLSLQVAGSLASAWLGGGDAGRLTAEPMLPLRLTARALAARIGRPWPEALADAASVDVGAHGDVMVSARHVAAPVGGARWLVLVDGVDEIADVGLRTSLIEVLAARAADPDSGCRLLVTTRPLAEGVTAGPLGGRLAAYVLEPFDRDALETFAARWFDPDGTPSGAARAAGFLAAVGAAGLAEIITVPLLATVAAVVLEIRDGQALPTTRFDLYEAYLAYLSDGRHAHAGEAAAHVRARLGREPAAARLVDLLDERGEELLGYLGATRVETDRPLLAVAGQWLADQQATPPRPPPDWPLLVTGVLSLTGPLVPRGDDVDFLHHSFAEHYAAAAHARALPSNFDPADPAWAEALHAARHVPPERRGDRRMLARDVLVHYNRRRPAAGAALLTWIQEGDLDDQLLAATLMVDGAHATPKHLTRWLDAAGALVAVSNVRSSEAVTLTAGLAPVALAVRFLKRIAYEPGTQARVRAHALARLAHLDADSSERAVRALQELAADQNGGLDERLLAAEGLAEMGGRSRTWAIAIVAEWAVADRPDNVDDLRAWVRAVTLLATLDPGRNDDAAGLLRNVAMDGGSHGYGRVDAAAALGGLAPGYRPEAADLLAEMAVDERTSGEHRFSAVYALATAFPERRSSAIDLLKERGQTNVLALLGLDGRTEAVALLRQEVAQAETDPDDPLPVKAWAMLRLARLEPAFRAEAAALLETLATDTSRDVGTRVRAAEDLLELGSSPGHRAAAVLHDIGGNPYVDLRERLRAVRLAERLTRTGQAARMLQPLLDHPQVRPRERLDLLIALAELAGMRAAERAMTIEAARALANDENACAAERKAAADALGELGPEFEQEAAAAHMGILGDATSAPADRCGAAIALAVHHRESRGEAAEALRAIACDERVDDASRARSAVWAGYLVPRLRDEAAATLVALASDRHADPHVRVRIAADLAHYFGPRFNDMTIDLLDSLARDPALSSAERRSAIDWMIILGLRDPYRRLDLDARQALTVDPCCAWAATAIWRQRGKPSDPDLLELLRRQMAHSGVALADRIGAATRLAGADAPARDQAAQVLRTLIDDPEVSGEDYEQAVQVLARRDPAFRTATLDAAHGPLSSAFLCLRAAHAIRAIAPGYGPQIAGLLRYALGAPDAIPAHHVEAASLLCMYGLEQRSIALQALELVLTAGRDVPNIFRAATVLLDHHCRDRSPIVAAVRTILTRSDLSSRHNRVALGLLARCGCGS